MDHHKRREYCSTRLRYRQGKRAKAVKVYTCAQESPHLLIFGVPKVNLQQELKRSIQRYGTLSSLQCVTDKIAKQVELEIFTDAYHIQFQRIEYARRAKRHLDAHQFYGGILHISYAPEYETLDELRQKLQKRKQEVIVRERANAKSIFALEARDDTISFV